MRAPQAQEVHLEQARVLHVLLVPLDHRPPLHGGVLDGHQVVDGVVAQQEAPGVDGEVAGEVLDLQHQGGQVAQGRVLRVEAGLADEVLVPVPVGHLPGQAVQAGGRDLEDLAHLPDGGPVPVAYHVGHHGGVGAPVLLVHVLDHLLPAVVLDVQVDVRRLGPFPWR